MIQNPILRGFCPDPSIVRAGKDYYIATSTFEWFPGVKLFHSTDLHNWTQLPSPLDRMSQLDMTGDPTSGGVWAPCLSYDGRRFYLVFTDVKTKKGRYYNTHNYVVTSEDIRGPWSEPIYLNSVGFDPSLFHDTDGRKYLINMVNGFKGILVQELDPASLTPVGERRKVYSGSGIGCTEGPHMYHIGGWYYLLVAEGGTGYEHCVTMARSKSVWGPFETAPDNPILTSDRDDPSALQKCGHADVVETPSGEWYMVHLCSRPLSGKRWCTLGRETAIQKMRWDEDGWLRLASGGKYARMETEGPKDAVPSGADSEDFFDGFDGEALSVRYSTPRVPLLDAADIKSRPGWLRLRGRESMNSLHRVTLLAARQRRISETAETVMEFSPKYPEQLAGLTYMYDAMNFYILGLTAGDTGARVLTLVKSDGGVVEDAMEPIPVPDGPISLRVGISEDGTEAAFSFAASDGVWRQTGEPLSTEVMTDEHCRGFTGAHFGLYVHDMTGAGLAADFDSFEVRGNG